MSSSRGRVAPKATCDVCGRERDALPGVFTTKAGRRTCNWHPFVAEEVLEATPYITFQAKPIKDARPFDPRPSYQLAEEQILSFLEEFYRYGALSAEGGVPWPIKLDDFSATSTSAWSAGWAGIYAYEVAAENKRPIAFVARARNLLRACADWLVANQSPSILGQTPSSELVNWGAYNLDAALAGSGALAVVGTGAQQNGDYSPLSSAAAGIALLRAYQLFGTASYLTAARACAWFIRTCQCGDLVPVSPASSDAAGASLKHWGGWVHRICYAGGKVEAGATGAGATVRYRFSQRFEPSSLLCLWFLTLYMQVVGDEVIGSSTLNTLDPGGVAFNFTSSRAALVSQCIAEGRAFWTEAQASVPDGGPALGLSTTTPRAAFDSYPADKIVWQPSAGGWVYSDLTSTGKDIDGRGWALALYALYQVEGASALVTGIFDWLATFASNPLYELPATTPLRMVTGYDDNVKLAGQKGTYAPKAQIATVLTVRDASLAATKLNGSAYYDIGAAGLLAALSSPRQPAAFKEVKDALDQVRPLSTQDDRFMFLGPMGICGLSYQPWSATGLAFTATSQRRLYPARAAMAGLLYRQAPQAWLGRGH